MSNILIDDDAEETQKTNTHRADFDKEVIFPNRPEGQRVVKYVRFFPDEHWIPEVADGRSSLLCGRCDFDKFKIVELEKQLETQAICGACGFGAPIYSE